MSRQRQRAPTNASTAHTSKCFQCKHISYLYSIRMESCIHRAVRANSSPLHPSIPSRDDACYPEWRARQSETTRMRAYVCACVYVAFAPVILNIREDISILVGKHTNSSSATYSYGAVYSRGALHTPMQVVPDLAERGPRKMLSLRLLTGETCRLEPPGFPREKRDFPNRKKIRRHFPYPNGRIRLSPSFIWFESVSVKIRAFIISYLFVCFDSLNYLA